MLRNYDFIGLKVLIFSKWLNKCVFLYYRNILSQ